jgi:antitoxin component YwqK of YwqJK toxin-antitoxin module
MGMRIHILLVLAIVSFPAFGKKKPKLVTEYYYKELKKSEGYVLDGQRNGTWKYWNNEGDLERIEHWKNDQLNGWTCVFKTSLFFVNANYAERENFSILNYNYFLKRQKENIKHDTLEVGKYRNNEKDSIWTFYNYWGSGWYLGNTKEKVTYKNGKKNGTAWRFSHFGLEQVLNYMDDFKYGACTTYRYEGAILRIENFEHDTLNGVFFNTETAYKKIKGSYNKGKLNGYYEVVDEDNKVIEKGNYVNGIKQGAWFNWSQYSGKRSTMYTYLNDSLYGPYEEIDYDKNPGEFLRYNLPGLFEINFDLEEFTQISSVKISGNYLGGRSRTMNVFVRDSVSVATYEINNKKKVIGNYKLFKKGKIYFNGYFNDGRADSTWTYYYEDGNVSAIQKYKIQKYESENYVDTFSTLVYARKMYKNGKLLSVYDGEREKKEIFYETGKLHSSFVNGKLKNGDYCAIERNFNREGRLCRLRIYDEYRKLIRQALPLPRFSDTLSLFDDDEFHGIFVLIPIPEQMLVIEDRVYEQVYVEESPSFPGGEGELYKYFEKKCIFNHAFQGKAIVSFSIGKSGEPLNTNIIKDNVGHGNAIELSKTILDMPCWMPGKINGRPVITLYELTCKFSNRTDIEFELKLINKNMEDDK